MRASDQRRPPAGRIVDDPYARWFLGPMSRATLRTVCELSAVGSEIAMDFWYLLDQPDMVSTAYRLSPNLLYFIGEPITFGIHPEDVGPFLERLGLHPLEVADAKALEERYVRDGRHVGPGVYLVHAGTNRATMR